MPAGLAIGGLAAVGAIGGAYISSNAAKSASETQAAAGKDAANIAAASSERIAKMQLDAGKTASDTIGASLPQSWLDPYIQGGTNAFQSLAQLYGVATPGNPGGQQGVDQGWQKFLNTPAYQFAAQQGNLGLDRTAASRGLLLSGGQLKDAMAFNQGLATQQIGNYSNVLDQLSRYGVNAMGMNFNRGQAQGNALMGSTNAAGSTLWSGTQAQTNALLGSAQSTASGAVGSANAWSGGLSGAGNNLLMGYGMSRFGNNNAATTNPSSYQPAGPPMALAPQPTWNPQTTSSGALY